ncbi:MAG: disulfide bond formation protein DsbB [Myxococcota bacterium]|jgi:disulfide bond formation protein DsbB
MNEPTQHEPGWEFLFAAWLIATASTLGSMFFSEVMELPPCSLCWYQRIFMFPLPIVLFMGLMPTASHRFDVRAVRYALPLAVIGWLIALYHLGLQSGVIPESAAPCTQGVSCTDVTMQLFGFLSIPMLSLLSFTTMIGLMLALKKRLK